MAKKIIFLFLLCFLSSMICVQAQTKEELQRKQQELIKEIRDLNASLKAIRNSKTKSLANYNLIKRKINAREELIRNINRDLHILSDNIYLNTLEINRLNRELDTLKKEYAKSLVFAYKNRSNYDYLNFIFSANTFNDAIKRITYLKSYKQYREQQVENIQKTQLLINQKIASLENSKIEKNLALTNQNTALKDLEEDKKEQNEEVNMLKQQESSIAQQIKKREADRKQMQNAIAAIIRREIEEARKKAIAEAKRKKEEEEKKKRDAANIAKTKPPTGITTPEKNEPLELPKKPRTASDRIYSDLESTDESKQMSINFETSRGRLPWPADIGVVSIGFGTYTIPGTQIKGRSDGIYVALPTGSSVKNVANGEVSAVYDLGGEQAVTVRHGKYFTTYSHLSSVNVNQGQTVRPGTIIGRAAANDAGEGELLFMVINEQSVFLDPENWLKRR